MHKTQLIEKMAEETGLTKKAAGEALESFINCLTGSLSEGESVVIVGLGTFSLKSRAERNGRNPKTGEALVIAASKNVGFKAAKVLKDALN